MSGENEKSEKKGGKGTNGNLIPPAPGERRNPNGRPKGSKNRATVLKSLLEISSKKANPLKSGKVEKMTVEQQIMISLINQAFKGNVRAIELVNEIMYGKIPQDVNLGGQVDNPVLSDTSVTKSTPLQLLIIKYGADSGEVQKFRKLYPDAK